MERLILVCDDVSKEVIDWDARIGETLKAVNLDGWRVATLRAAELREAVERLERRRTRHDWGDESLFDVADIVLVDYDLEDIEGLVYLTGESVAYLARAYSQCGVIVGMNYEGPVPQFDLTLKGHLGSYADVHVAQEHVTSPGLWSDERSGYRPWAWPLLPNAADSFPWRAKEVEANWDTPIFAYFGFNEEIRFAFNRETVEFLSGKDDPISITFKDVVAKSKHFLRGKDEPNPLSHSRLIAARLSQWLLNQVLAPQDLLVDAPHLVQRYPSLLAGDAASLDIWNETTRLAIPDKLPLNTRLISDAIFRKWEWLGRPTWFWPKLQDMAEIPEVQDPFKEIRIPFVFAEDLSRFVPIKDARAFLAAVDSPFAERFVYKAEADKQLGEELRRVSYEPALRFAL